MVSLRKHWHFAHEHNLFGERRFLAIAADPRAPQSIDVGADIDAEGNRISALPATDVGQKIAGEMSKNQRDILDILQQQKPEKQEKDKGKKFDKAERAQDDALIQRETIRKEFEGAGELFANTINQMQTLKRQMESKSTLEKIEQFASPTLRDNWMRDIRSFDYEIEQSGREKLFMDAMLAFWEGESSPEVFLAEQGQYLQNLPYGFAEMGSKMHELIKVDDGEKMAKAGVTQEAWPTLNESTRLAIVADFLKNVQMTEWLANKKTQNRSMEKTLKRQEQWVQNVEKSATAAEASLEAEKGKNLITALRKIRFYSINDYINGFKKYGSALKSTWEQRGERYSADIARKVGEVMAPFNFMPFYGQEVENILDQQLDAKSNEEAEAMKKQLESNNTKWAALFMQPQGEFWKFAGKNPNKTRGVLEYAAEHGFLYDIDDNATGHDQTIYGMKLADLCFDWQSSGDDKKIHDYFTSLRGKNASGREHEQDHGYKMEHDVENVPLFIRLLEHEMDEDNLWAAAGICKRAMERGLRGEVAAWLFTTVMDKLKERPALRAVTPISFFDIIGKLSMYSTAFTLGWAKGYRNELRAWAKTGDDAILDNTELRQLSVIEKDIMAKDPTTNYRSHEGRKQMNELVAKVLAGHIVELPGGYIHIFETRFKSYRQAVTKMFAQVADPHKEDTDYAREDTEKAMLPEVVFKKVLRYTSTREFADEGWAAAFMGNLLSMAKRMKQIPLLQEAYTNYCDEVREKMDLHFSSYMRDATAVKQLSVMDPVSGKPIIAALVNDNLLSWSTMRNAEYAEALAEQMKNVFPLFYATEIKPFKQPWEEKEEKKKEKTEPKITPAAQPSNVDTETGNTKQMTP